MMIIGQKQPPEMFYKKGNLKYFTKLMGKHLCWSLKKNVKEKNVKEKQFNNANLNLKEFQ